jgi:hypothetical protein
MLMAGEDPYRTDKTVRSLLAPYLGSCFEEIVSSEFDVRGYRLVREVDDRERAAMCALILPFVATANGQVVRGELARLRSSVVTRNQDEDEVTMRLQVLGEECEEWPADVVRAALRGWARREKFFPCLAELREELQRHGSARRSLARMLAA